MNSKRILVTGAAGFIGFHVTRLLLQENHEVYGIDNINDYYSTSLKNDRLDILKTKNNFKFSKIDISNHDDLSQVFNNFKPEIVLNLAAQAGVRFSLENSRTYLDNNIIEEMKQEKII